MSDPMSEHTGSAAAGMQEVPAGSDPDAMMSNVPEASQAERAVMHPDSSDVEWRYCQGAW